MSQDKVQAEMEQRAKEFWHNLGWGNALNLIDFPLETTEVEDEIVLCTKFAAAFSVSEVERAVEAERMECAKSICVMCRNGKELISNAWIHLDTFNGNKEKCKASAIHERGAAKDFICIHCVNYDRSHAQLCRIGANPDKISPNQHNCIKWERHHAISFRATTPQDISLLNHIKQISDPMYPGMTISERLLTIRNLVKEV